MGESANIDAVEASPWLPIVTTKNKNNAFRRE